MFVLTTLIHYDAEAICEDRELDVIMTLILEPEVKLFASEASALAAMEAERERINQERRDYEEEGELEWEYDPANPRRWDAGLNGEWYAIVLVREIEVQ